MFLPAKGKRNLSQGHRAQGREESCMLVALDLSHITPKLKTVFLRAGEALCRTDWGHRMGFS